ncbi:hypothetical protein HZC09_01155 [Candidatus Micrarchaeota archaeon]|nr:hypothetical protein [Candidatus Micrarchaeota archaeon]
MKIPIRLLNDQLSVVAYFKAQRHRVPLSVVSFIVDTGSNRSMLGYEDVERLNLPQNTLEFVEDSRIGGCSIGLHKIDAAVLLFTDESDNGRRFELDFSAGLPLSKKEFARCAARLIPSILGLDFLRKTGLSLHCFPKQNDYYFGLEGLG